MDVLASDQITKSLQRLVNATQIELNRVEDQLLLNGCDVVDNGLNKAIINENVREQLHV